MDEVKQNLRSLERRLDDICNSPTELENIKDVCDQLEERIRYQEETSSELSENLWELEKRFNQNEAEKGSLNSDVLDNLRSDVEAMKEENVTRDSSVTERNDAVSARLEDLSGRTSVLETASHDFHSKFIHFSG